MPSQFFWAVHCIQGLEQHQHIWIGHCIVDVLAFAPGGDQSFVAQHTELLRQGRLADVEQALQLADRVFPLAKLAQQQQAILVRECA